MKNIENIILDILKKHPEISGYKLVTLSRKSRELFLIKDKLDLNRGKTSVNYTLTVYVEFTEDGEKYLGSASIRLAPTLSADEIERKIVFAHSQALSVKTKWYPLAKPSSATLINPTSDIEPSALGDTIEKIATAILSAKGKTARINSAEVFLTMKETHLCNSNGVDVSYTNIENKIEVITSCDGEHESVEVYGDAHYANCSIPQIKELVEQQLLETENRSIAQKSKHIENIPVILRNSSVSSFFSFFVDQTSGGSVFHQASRAEVGKNFQGENIAGDLLTITLKPFLENASASEPFDKDGFVLKPIKIFDKGVVKQIHADLQMAHYLHIEPTGFIPCFEVECGSVSYDEMLEKPHVEIFRFSDFLCDPVTGDFGGEFRLAKYFDGEKTHIIHNGAISANIFAVQKEFYFSKERMQENSYLGPKAILIPGLTISG